MAEKSPIGPAITIAMKAIKVPAKTGTAPKAPLEAPSTRIAIWGTILTQTGNPWLGLVQKKEGSIKSERTMPIVVKIAIVELKKKNPLKISTLYLAPNSGRSWPRRGNSNGDRKDDQHAGSARIIGDAIASPALMICGSSVESPVIPWKCSSPPSSTSSLQFLNSWKYLINRTWSLIGWRLAQVWTKKYDDNWRDRHQSATW